MDLNGHPALGEEIEGVGVLSLSKKQRTRLELFEPRPLRQQFHRVG
jgi:hypothetical protein